MQANPNNETTNASRQVAHEATALSAPGVQSSRKRVVVLGAGFGGLEFTRQFRQGSTEIILIDRQNHHLFQPLLYQVATAGLSIPEIAAPIREIVSDRRDVTVLLDEVQEIDLDHKIVRLTQQPDMEYDYLVIGLGARTSYFGNDHWEAHAPGLKSLDDAARIRQDVLLAYEEAENSDDPVRRSKLLTFVVIGGGPTGVEMAGAFAELARYVLKRDYRRVNPADARVILIEAGPRILAAFEHNLSESAQRQLESLGVEVRLNCKVTEIDEGTVIANGERIDAATILWTAGVAASPLTQSLNVPKDRAGRLMVLPDLSLPGHPEVFAVGDITHLVDAAGKPVPGLCPAALQMGAFVARLLIRELSATTTTPYTRPKFTYLDKGIMATIGRSRAVAQSGKLRFRGFSAWLMWLFIHLIFLVGFRNKLAVLLQWAYSYVTHGRGARIISGLDKSFRICNLKATPLSRLEKRTARATRIVVSH